MTPKLHRLFSIIALFELIILCSFGAYYIKNIPSQRHIRPVTLQAQNSVSIPTPQSSPTLMPPSITPTPAPKKTTDTYTNPTYGFHLKYPVSWHVDQASPDTFSKAIFLLTSTTSESSIKLSISDGIWSDVKLELGHSSTSGKFAGKPALIRTSKTSKTYIFPSSQKDTILQLVVTHPNKDTDKILSSFALI